MLQTMRQNTKAILWVVVISFVITIFAVWGLDLQTGTGTNDPNIVGKVNGVAISRSQYQYAYQQFAEQMRGEVPGLELTYAQEEFARTQAWESIVYSILLEQEIEKLGITVTDQEIVDYLRTSPPPEIQQHFVDEQGQFDNQAYQAALSNPEIDWTSLEQLARERILRLKLNEYLAAQVHVSEQEARDAYEAETTELSMAYVEFPIVSADVGDYRPSDEDIVAHYQANPDQYTEPETCTLSLVRIPLKPSARDREDAVATTRDRRDEALAGEDFGVLAQKFSEAPTSFVEGNTGYITRDQRPAAYFDALDGLQKGEITDAIETDDGVYLVKLIDKRKGEKGPEYSAQEIFISVRLTGLTTDSLYAVASDVVKGARDAGLEKAAAGLGLEVQTPAAFARDGAIEGVGEVRSLNAFAFANETGAVSEPLRDDENIYVAQVVERVAERVTPLADAREMVIQYILLEKRRDVAERNARAFYQKAKESDFKTALATYGIAEKKAEKFKVGDNLPGLGANSTLAQAALAAPTSGIRPPVEWRLTFYVVNVLSRTAIDEADYQAKVASFKRRVLDRKAQAYGQSWYQKLQEGAEIDDYRVEG
jgi:parvulin-like peptidyl-prolyl isomerase